MEYSEIIKSICARANDPEKDRLEDRAKDHFIDAIYGIIDSGEYELEDIPEYYKMKQDVNFTEDEDADSSYTYDFIVNDLKVYKVLELFPDPTNPLTGAADRLRFTIKSVSEIKNMANNSAIQPSAEDMFVYRVGNTLYLYAGSNFNDNDIFMTYIQNIDNSVWGNSTELTNYFSTKLIRKAIGIAGVNLLKEDSL